MKFVVTILLSWLVTEFIGYLFHRFVHSPLAGRLHRGHMSHHLDHYPQTRYLSDKYEATPRSSLTYYLAPFFFLLSALTLYLAPLAIGLTAVGTALVIAVINDRLHNYFHVLNTPMNKSRWFWKLREQHFIHHIDFTKNLGVYTFIFDSAFGTRKKSLNG